MTTGTILLIGRNGQLGGEIEHLLTNRDRFIFEKGDRQRPRIVAVDYPEIDLSSPDSIREALREHAPSLVINAAGYTAVDRAESEPDLAMAINGTAPGIMAEELKNTGGALVHYSTEYIFDGMKVSPYCEDDSPAPLSAYGRSKLAGEEAIRAAGCPHLVIRTSWLYGSRGDNFLLTILRLARERVELRVVNDQVGAPTWSRFVAEATAEILEKSVPFTENKSVPNFSGTLNVTSTGHTSWFGFAEAILSLDPRRAEQIVQRVMPVPSSDYPAAARRPLNCRLDCSRLRREFSIDPPPWQDSLAAVMQEFKETGAKL